MQFGFALDSPDIDLLNIDMLNTHLDLLHSDIPSKQFICLQDVLKTCSRHVFKTSSKHIFEMASRHFFQTSSSYVLKTSWRRLQRNNFSSSKTSWRYLEVLKTSCEMSSRRLQGVFKTSLETKNCYAEDVLKTSSRHVLKTSWKCLEDQQVFAGIIVCFFLILPNRPLCARNKAKTRCLIKDVRTASRVILSAI